jgi:hypothetical protein
VVFALAALALIAARYFLIPDTFGEIGHYRAAAIDTIIAHPKKFAGQQEWARGKPGGGQASDSKRTRPLPALSCLQPEPPDRIRADRPGSP